MGWLGVDWDAVTAIGQMIGALGVIISLIYLALQVRADARARRSATVHQLTQAFSDSLNAIANNADLARLIFKALTSDKALVGAELLQFETLLAGVFRLYEDSFFQYEARHLDARIWRGFSRRLGLILTYPATRTWWAGTKDDYSPEFQALIAAKLAAAGLKADRPAEASTYLGYRSAKDGRPSGSLETTGP